MNDHKTVTDDARYDITFHPAFASECAVTDKATGQTRKLYVQDRSKPENVKDKGHPKKHTIKLKGKGNNRDITITIDDPSHTIHSLSFELYDEARDPAQTGSWGSTETVTVTNTAVTCPPYCEPT